MLAERRIILGVCGGIAAYKAAELARLLVRDGARVRVVLTTGAEAFIKPLLFEALTREKAFCQKDFLSPQGGFIPHTDLGAWAEAIVVAPATASFLSKLARGEPSDLLTAIIMASRARVFLVPAMNTLMWTHPATQENLKHLQSFGYTVRPPDTGELACGIEGPGRFPPPEILWWEIRHLLLDKPLAGQKVLITGGPTREFLDEVRFLSNPSSGRMAVALAQAAWLLGAEVHLVHGPLGVSPLPTIHCHPVTSAEEMLKVSQKIFPEAKLAIFCAAVCDFRPAERLTGKVPKETFPREIRLEPTPDIAATLSRHKKEGQITVAFALEEKARLADSARQKLRTKGVDFIVANDLSAFEAAESEVFLLSSPEEAPRSLRGPKEELALRLLQEILHVSSSRT